MKEQGTKDRKRNYIWVSMLVMGVVLSGILFGCSNADDVSNAEQEMFWPEVNELYVHGKRIDKKSLSDFEVELKEHGEYGKYFSFRDVEQLEELFSLKSLYEEGEIRSWEDELGFKSYARSESGAMDVEFWEDDIAHVINENQVVEIGGVMYWYSSEDEYQIIDGEKVYIRSLPDELSLRRRCYAQLG